MITHLRSNHNPTIMARERIRIYSDELYVCRDKTEEDGLICAPTNLRKLSEVTTISYWTLRNHFLGGNTVYSDEVYEVWKLQTDMILPSGGRGKPFTGTQKNGSVD